MNFKKFLPNGWTVTFFVLAGLFSIGITQPGIMAAAFFVSIGLLNEAVDRWF